MGKMKERAYILDLLNGSAALNDMVVRFEMVDADPKYVLYPVGSDRVIAAYENADSMFGFLDGLDFNRTGRGPAE